MYVHIPFCATKCPYCDFNTYARIEPLIPGYVEALATELRAWGSLLDRPEVSTIFFGGGTPSYLPAGALARLTETIRLGFAVAADAEVTAEANPDDCTPERLESMRAAGINRISLGVQSLDDGLLKVLGRRHDSSQAIRAFGAARAAGFANASLDLMFGLPGQTMAQWTSTFEKALALGPDHVSMYGLTVEPNTAFASDIAAGRLATPDGDLAADMYEFAIDRMSRLGYRHYEISNWALPGRESRHNLAYWRNAAYLGAGPGAHSYLGQWRFANLKSPREYIRRTSELAHLPPRAFPSRTPTQGSILAAIEQVRAAGVLESVEAIAPPLEMAETMMMGLRLDDGIDAQAFRDRFGVAVDTVYGSEIRELVGLGLIEFDMRGVRLTARGQLLGNEVFQRFMLVPQRA
ncbi:MAG: radical SAM family heme chaperone HemW [Chloroflexi bacterium]|nr:radical SAM family heme chaperone HemW [Chloroflexota bacterium]